MQDTIISKRKLLIGFFSALFIALLPFYGASLGLVPALALQIYWVGTSAVLGG